MDRKTPAQEAIEIIDKYDKVLKNSAKRTFVFPESKLPYSKEAIKSAIRAVLMMTEDMDTKEHLKSRYISLGYFVPDSDVMKVSEISKGLFPFLNMDEEAKREFIRKRFESGLLGDYELATRISRKIAEEQKRLKKEIDEFLEIHTDVESD